MFWKAFKKLIFFASFFSLLSSCIDFRAKGSLTVRGFEGGTFEIFKVASESPLQFVSELLAKFNQEMTLDAGSYLVLADCSSELITIYPSKHHELVTHRVHFVPPIPPTARDRFTITCTRADRAEFRQTIAEKFSIDVLSGKREILVGMKPVSLDFGSDANEQKPTQKSYLLSSVTVGDTFQETEKFFVSSIGDLAPHTEPQSVGSRQFILPGEYLLEMNGTQTNINIAVGQKFVVHPSRIIVHTSENLNLDQSDRISGTPLHFELNGNHFLKLNHEYSILPGKLSIRMSQERLPAERDVEPGEFIQLQARSVQVEASCKQEDWKCLGQRKVRVFDAKSPAPIAEGVTDVAILFLAEGAFIGIEGSRDIKTKLSKSRDQKFRLGYLNVKPNPTHVFGAISDLLRVESASAVTVGSTLDLQLDVPSRVPLVEGYYTLAHYISQTGSDGNRRRVPVGIAVRPGGEEVVEVTTYLSEKKILSLRSKEKKETKPR